MTELLVAMVLLSADFYVEDYRSEHVTDYKTITAAIDAASPGDNIHFDGSRIYSPAKRIELYGETAIGHGATIRRPDEWNVVTTQPANIGDTIIHVDAVTEDVVYRNQLTLVEYGADTERPFRDGMEKGGKQVQSWDSVGRTIEFQTPIAEAFPAGSSVFRVDSLMTTFGSGSADNFVFDGNRTNNDSHISADLIYKWFQFMQEKRTHKNTGLYTTEVLGTRKYSDQPRGCSLSYMIHYMGRFSQKRAAEQWKLYKKHMMHRIFGKVGFREYLVEYDANWSPDSGPIIGGIGVAATGLALNAASTVGDKKTYKLLEKTMSPFHSVFSMTDSIPMIKVLSRIGTDMLSSSIWLNAETKQDWYRV